MAEISICVNIISVPGIFDNTFKIVCIEGA